MTEPTFTTATKAPAVACRLDQPVRRLSPAQHATLIEASKAPREVCLGYNNGAARAAMTRKMDRLCAMGLMRPYVHGGWEITDAGRVLVRELAAANEQARATAADNEAHRVAAVAMAGL